MLGAGTEGRHAAVIAAQTRKRGRPPLSRLHPRNLATEPRLQSGLARISVRP